MLLVLAACGSLGGQDEEGRSGAALDEPCGTAEDCAAPTAECLEYDGKDRCVVTDCSSDAECGGDGACLDGECWRPCDSTADCAEPDWECRPLQLSGDATSRTFCVAPCRLTSCSLGGFRYSCATGSYSSSESYDYGGPNGTSVTVTVSYSNGNVVRCSGTSAEGSCSDDSGASCSW